MTPAEQRDRWPRLPSRLRLAVHCEYEAPARNGLQIAKPMQLIGPAGLAPLVRPAGPLAPFLRARASGPPIYPDRRYKQVRLDKTVSS